MPELAPQSEDLQIIWGAAAIAAALGTTRGRTFHMLESGALPGARKIAGRWCITRAALLRIFEGESAA
jgi:hypothetical protein